MMLTGSAWARHPLAQVSGGLLSAKWSAQPPVAN